MAVDSGRFIIQNLYQVSCYDIADGYLKWVASDLQEGNMTNAQETVYATGRNGVRIGAFDRNKTSTFTATNGSIVLDIMADQTGNTPTTGQVTSRFMEVLTVGAGGTMTVTHKPQGNTLKEIPYIYKKNSDGTIGTKYAQAATASATAFAYAPATGIITPPDGGTTAGTQYIVTYDVKVKSGETGKKIENYDGQYSSEGYFVFDIVAKDICTGNDYLGRITYPHGKISGNFEFAFGSDPSVQNLEIEALADVCNVGSNGSLLWDLVVFDEDDLEDIA